MAGTVGMVCNSGSIISSMEQENPDLLANTQIIQYPAVSADDTSYTLGGANVFGIFETGANTDVAKELFPIISAIQITIIRWLRLWVLCGSLLSMDMMIQISGMQKTILAG
ncbi:MAG: hypothetical protein V8Q93_12225 [Blautia faecis]